MINLSATSEVSTFTHYKDTKSNAKCRIGWFLEVRGYPS